MLTDEESVSDGTDKLEVEAIGVDMVKYGTLTSSSSVIELKQISKLSPRRSF